MATTESRSLGTRCRRRRSWCCPRRAQGLPTGCSSGPGCAISSQWAERKPTPPAPKQPPPGAKLEVGSSFACSAAARWWRGSGPGWSRTSWGWTRCSTWRRSRARWGKTQARVPRLHTARWAWRGASPPAPPWGQTGTKRPGSSLRCNAKSGARTPKRWAARCRRLSRGWWRPTWRLTTRGRCWWCSRRWRLESCRCNFPTSQTGKSPPWCWMSCEEQGKNEWSTHYPGLL